MDKYKLRNIIKYAVWSVMLMLFLITVGKSRSDVAPYLLIFLAFLYGIFIGIYKQYFEAEKLERSPFLLKLIINLVILQLIFMASGIIFEITRQVLEPEESNSSIIEFLFSRERLPQYGRALVYGLILNIWIEIELLLGAGFFWEYLSGKYSKPKKELRAFMFLDLKDSTKITEDLGDEKFLYFINDCYKLLTKPIINHKGNILKYVGDEVIISWWLNDAQEDNNCVNFFYDYVSELEMKREYFMKEYGVMPTFKAGVHGGQVSTAYLGSIKKQVDFSGAVLNVTSRIVSKCNEYETDLLLSKEIFSKLVFTTLDYEKIEGVALRGIANKVDLYSIISPNFAK